MNEDVLKRIATWEDMYNKVRDRTTIAYLQLLNAMRSDYETVKNEDACVKVCIEIELFIANTELQDPQMGDILLASYDSRARCGDFRAYCIALEWNRPIDKQFFLPRRRILEKHGLIQAFQDLSDDKLDFLCLNLPPRIGKSTMSLFFLTFRAGLYPELSILGNGHSTSLTQSFYNEVMNILTSEEYRFNDIFPTLKIAKNSSEYSWIDLDKVKRFHTLMFKSVDGGTTGLAEASNLLYCDDLVKDVETANNPDRLEKLFYTYTSTIQDRKVQRLCKDGVYRPCPELHVNTPWSINDVTNRLIALYGDDGKNPRVRIISVPCYDENGESNFEYDYGKGFDKNYYHQLQMAEDPVIFSAKYLMECIERDGIVFSEDSISYYNELPNETPDRIIAYADVSHGGEDYFSIPIGYLYGRDVYIEDVWFENKFGGDDYSRPKVCDIIKRHNVNRLGVEKNNGGDFYATLIEKDLKESNYRCNITTHNAPTNKSKCDRILACQNEIKGTATETNTYRLFFKSKEARRNNKYYNMAMQQLFKWNQNFSAQKKQHDDFPDSLAGMITNVLGGQISGRASSKVSLDKYGL